jgi:hypothetical protein
MKKLVSIVLFLTICSSGFFAENKVKKEKVTITEEEYAIYEVVGVRNYENETTNYPFRDDNQTGFPNLSAEVVTDYTERNSNTYFLRWVQRKDQKKKLPKSWGGTLTVGFSRIGFNKDESEALVYVGWSGIGNTCESDFIHLKKQDGRWAVVKKVMVLIC